MDWMELTITKPPENGEARLIDMNTIPNYTAPNPRTKCNDKSAAVCNMNQCSSIGLAIPAKPTWEE
jgi:hypothetical protein